MVIHGDLNVELVEATTKQPFREHYHNGKTYVEVEPGAEYYLSHQRVGCRSKEPFLVLPYVDGKSVGWQGIYDGKPRTDKDPIYRGSWRTITWNGRSDFEEVSLKFARASSGHTGSDPTLMGKVEFRLFEDDGPGSSLNMESSEFATSKKNSVSSAVAAAAKAVRSTQGSSMKRIAPKPGHYCGAYIETITLHYCTAPGLIKVGILPKPPNVYALHQLVTGKKPTPLPPLLVQPRKITAHRDMNLDGQSVSTEVKTYDFFDLSVLDSDSEEDDTLARRQNDRCSPPAPRLVGEQRARKKPRF